MEYDPTQANLQALLAVEDETMKQRNVEPVLFEGRRVGEHTNAEKLDWFAAELEHHTFGADIWGTPLGTMRSRGQVGEHIWEAPLELL